MAYIDKVISPRPLASVDIDACHAKKDPFAVQNIGFKISDFLTGRRRRRPWNLYQSKKAIPPTGKGGG